MKQSLSIFVFLLLGVLFPQGEVLSFLIRYNLMVMLVFAFFNIRFQWQMLRWAHLWIVLCNLGMALLAHRLVLPLGNTIAMAAFFICMAPTAAAAPVMAGFLRTRVEFVTISVLLTSPMVALVLPLVLPHLVAVDESLSFLDVMLPVAMIIGVPLLLSWVLRQLGAKVASFIDRNKMLPFYFFLANIWIASGQATVFIRDEYEGSLRDLWIIAFVILLCCLTNFKLGERLVSKELAYAGGLSLGRKNSMFALWLALTFVNPMAALGPIFYILFQNLYNAYQIYQVERKKGPA
ncbi:MAG: hypothetical protein AAFV95_00835 [Bacteroidota bacterium]